MHGKFGAAANHCLQASIKGRCLRENCDLFGLNFSKKAESNSAAIIPKARKHGGSPRKRMSRTSACFSEAIVSERELWTESWPSKNRTADGTRPYIRSRNDNTKKNGLDQAMHYWGVAERNENLLSFRIRAVQGQSFTSARPRRLADHEELQSRKTLRNCAPEPRDTPPKPDAGIGSEEDWGIDLKYGNSEESGVSEDGSTWYRESGEDLGKNGYRCCWTIMGGRSADGSSEWKEAWWEKSDWTGYKELGAEKSGKNSQGETWWETWQEVLHHDEWSNLSSIEKSAQKQQKSGNGVTEWHEKWWEKYNAKGWIEKGAYKHGKLSDQIWWEKWGEQYDGHGAMLKWMGKWAENDMGTKWGDKWEEIFFSGMGTRQGETWHSSSSGERWFKAWREEHFGNGKVHKYGKSTSGEIWDDVVEEGTSYQAEPPHYGWAEAVGSSVQLLSIKSGERPPGVYPDISFFSERSLQGPSPSPDPPSPDQPPPPTPD